MATRKLVTINLIEGVKVRNLAVPDMTLVVIVDVDSELQALIDKGKEGLRWSQLADAAENYSKPAQKILKEELTKFDDVVATLDEAGRKKKIAEVQSVLKQVAAGQEAGVNAAVDAEWKAAMRRSETLTKFKIKCTVKAIVGALAIASSLTSMIASGGANLLGVVAIFKACGELAILAADIAQSVDEAAGELDVDLEAVREQVAKEMPKRSDQVISDLSPIIGKCMSTVKTADQNQTKLEAKIAALEKTADDLVGSLNAGLDKLSKIKTEEEKKKDFIKELEKENRSLIAQIMTLQKELKPIIKFNEDALKEIKDWKAKREPKTVAAIRAASFVKAATGLLTAARVFAKVAGAPIP